ncbi:hypothetical protein C9374_011417 [Naegleria lovaniensis]|uniref:Kinesin motor domain-containing protein n=1 Tax=Naegleria lovaniensis TaxID=51637 RepID=A0AA88KQV3_NAELO|nr:uncharacterized protein C9374_011417 [Naegleria lovaniensis]KAG2392692.1 hypothetical protein C9374_011417 [Naegleria lovaniensis]
MAKIKPINEPNVAPNTATRASSSKNNSRPKSSSATTKPETKAAKNDEKANLQVEKLESGALNSNPSASAVSAGNIPQAASPTAFSDTMSVVSGINDGDETGIKVVVRMRPMNDRETKLKAQTCVSMNTESKEVLIKRKDKDDKKFFFDDVFDDKSTQQDVFMSTGKRVLDRFVLGFNGCIFAYGQTGSGKTWTMQGLKGEAEKEGIMTRFVRELFNYVTTAQEKTDITIKASYLEIYNENILDLLNPHSSRVQYDIREDKVKGIYVNNLIERPITNDGELNDILEEGAGRRTVGETKMNEVSSRSHSVLTISMEQIDKGDDDGFSLRTNKIALVDLAGSERAGATEATGDRLKEGAKINMSLSMLGNVINALVKKSNFVPYRNSKLTRLLKDSIGGNSYTLLVTCVSPADVNAEESLSTLYFADRAKQIKNKLKISRGDPRLEKIAELLELEKKLRARILELETELAKYTNVPPPQPEIATKEIISIDMETNTEIEMMEKRASARLISRFAVKSIQTDPLPEPKKGCCLMM